MKRRREPKRPGALGRITWMLTAGFLALWLGCMGCLTAVTAEEAAQRYLRQYGDQGRNISYDLERFALLERLYEDYRLWEAVDKSLVSTGGRRVAEGSNNFLKLRSSDSAFAANAIYDSAGNYLVSSWEDFFYFEYMTEEEWAAEQERSRNHARAVFDRKKLTEEGGARVDYNQMRDDARAMRFIGSFDGAELVPIKIECVDYAVFREALWSRGSGSYTVSGIVQQYDLPWITLYEAPDAVPAGVETVTLYSDWFEVCCTEVSPPFSYLGKDYSGIDALVQELGPSLSEGKNKVLHRYEGLDLLIVDATYCLTHEGEIYFSDYAGKDAYLGKAPEMHYYLVSGVYCSPWRTAMASLLYVYFVTFLLGFVCLLVIRSRIRDNLIAPIREVSGARQRDWAVINFENDPPLWREAWEVQNDYADAREYRRIKGNEVKRLETALEYVRTAEEHRRQMTSHIAHELKTPLAVVHSYAEGLQERIAEDKREKYLETILAETERMDVMVLEMLDLSRLEAGKVKLARDDFDLVHLAQSVWETLSIRAEEKNLQVTLDVPRTAMLAADEGRIRQVVENYLSNAVKYTPEGGAVAVRIFKESGKTVFSVTNDSRLLSGEELEKVWDTFWRADESRTGRSGTGLGLAIAKSIVELHGGTVGVRSTENGVEFRFVL